MSLFRPKDSRYWWYSFYFDGERYRKSTKKTKKTAAAVVEASLLARLQEGDAIELGRKKPPVLRDLAERFLEWADNSQQLTPNGKRYYRYGWRLLRLSKLAGMRIDQISQDVAESIVFERPLLNRRKKNQEGRYEEKKEMIACTGHYMNQALRTLKRMPGKAVKWKLLRDNPEDQVIEGSGVRSKQVHGARRPEVDGAVSAPGTGTTAGCDQPAQPAKKVWSGFWSGFGKRIVGANEPVTVSA